MFPFLAEASSSPTFTAGEFYAVCGVLVFILSAIALGKKIFVREPPLHRQFMERAECEKIHAKVQNDFDHEANARRLIYKTIEAQGKDIATLKQVDDRITRVEQAAAIRSDKLEAKLDANTILTSAIGGEVKQINQNVQLVLAALAQNERR
jgi:hypothetical protein